MCVICIDYQKQLLTADEARWNMREMNLPLEHQREIESMIEERELVEKLAAAPARYTFKVDVGSVPSEKVEAFLREAKRRINRP
jgi:hypothetical protein